VINGLTDCGKETDHFDDLAVMVSSMLSTRIVRETVFVTGWRIPVQTHTYQHKLEKQSETADLRQRHVLMASPYSVWQQFPLCPI